MVVGMKTGDSKCQSDIGPEPDGARRRRLTGRGNRLKAGLAMGRQGLTEAFVESVRRAFTHADLIKVRLDADSPKQADALAEGLAARTPCHLIKRIGRVALLYRPLPEGPDNPTAANEKGSLQ
jgi:RNA-binding protein